MVSILYFKSHRYYIHNIDDVKESYMYFFAYMGVATALIFANVGAAYGTSKSSIGVANLGCI